MRRSTHLASRAVTLLAARLFGRARATAAVAVFAAGVVLAARLGFGRSDFGAIGLLVAVTLVAAAPSLVDPPALMRLIARIPYVGRTISAVIEAVLYRRRSGPLGAGFACALAGHGLSLFAIFTLAHGVAIAVVPEFVQVLVAAPIAFLTTAAPLPANGLGVGEFAFDAILRSWTPAGAPVVVGGAALYLAFRMLGIVMSLVGLPFFLALRKARKDAG